MQDCPMSLLGSRRTNIDFCVKTNPALQVLQAGFYGFALL